MNRYVYNYSAAKFAPELSLARSASAVNPDSHLAFRPWPVVRTVASMDTNACQVHAIPEVTQFGKLAHP